MNDEFYARSDTCSDKSELVLDDRLAYLHAEEDAINARIGLWVEPNPIPPWEFRKANR